MTGKATTLVIATNKTSSGLEHFIRICPSETSGPHGVVTICGLHYPAPCGDWGEFYFGPEAPDIAARPDGMCATCWKVFCAGAWRRESCSACRPIAAITLETMAVEGVATDQSIWRLR